MSDILYLASQSQGRQALLNECNINYEVLRHDADECLVGTSLSFKNYVLEIARQKMDSVVFPEAEHLKEKPIFVVTSDTLICTKDAKYIFCKPENREDAKRMLRVISEAPVLVTTGCIVEKKSFDGSKWITVEKRDLTIESEIEFIIPEDELDLYLDTVPEALSCCGAGTIEGFGNNFLKSVKGSYSAIIGIPIFELREALKDMGFEF